MTTRHPGDLLSALLDDELEVGTAAAVEQHLSDCAPCRRELAEIDRTRRSLRASPPVEAPSGLASGLVARRRRADRRGASFALAAAAVAIVTSVAFADPAVDVSPGGGAESGIHESGDRDGQRRPDTPQGIRRADNAATSDPSVADRAGEAVRELLSFLS